MGKATVLLIAVVSCLSAPLGTSRLPDRSKPQAQVSQQATSEASPIHLTIATVAPLLGPPTDRYTVGGQVLVTISLANTLSQPRYACVSSDLYQDLPRLTKNGQVVPYTKWQSSLVRNAQKDKTCEHDDLPERMLLKTNEPTVVDFLVLVDDTRLPTGALSWYDPLTPGAYELSIQRRLDCCDGPMIESNKISFEVVP